MIMNILTVSCFHSLPYCPWLLPSNNNTRSLVFQVNRAADPKSEDGIIPSGNKTEAAAVSRTTGAAADKFRTPSDNDRESEDIAKIKRLKYDGGDEDVRKQ